MGLNYIMLSLQQFFNVVIAYMLCLCCSKSLGYCRDLRGTSQKCNILLKSRQFRHKRKVKRQPVYCHEEPDSISYFERKYKECLERYGQLIEFSPQPMIVQNNERIIFINPAGVKWFGLSSPTELIGRPIYDILPPNEILKARQRMDHILTHKYGEAHEYDFVTLKGQKIKAEVTGMYDEHTGSTIHFFYDVTEHKKMEMALKESMERYRRLVELSPIAIAVSKNGCLIYMNPSGMRIVRASELHEIVGTNPWSWVVNEDRDWEKVVRKELLENGYVSPEEMKIKRVDGEIIDIVASAIYDNQSGTVEFVIEDITERKQAEQALMNSEQLYRKLIEISPVAMLLHKNFTYTYVNPKALSLLGGAESDNLIGRPIIDMIHTDSKALVMDYLNEVYQEQGAIELGEHRILRFDGSVIEVEAVSASFPFKGAGTAVTIVRDITEQKRAEEDRKYAENRIRESEDRYFRLQMSLDQFSSDLFGMVKIEDLNSRFVREVCQVISTDKVSFIEVDRESKVTVTHGYHQISHYIVDSIQECCAENLPLCEMIDTLDGHYVKIGEVHGKSCILCVGENSPVLLTQATKVWLETISRYVSVLYDNFRVIKDLTREVEQFASQQTTPVWLLRFMFQLSENERKNLAQDLHDAALQEQIIWYRRLDQLISERNLPEGSLQELESIRQGLLDVIYQIRITCNELRPPLLKEVGLERSLEALFEFTQLRSDYAIRFHCIDVSHDLDDDLMIGLYRIVQEMLANASKHSNATQVIIKLYSDLDMMHLNYEDNGIGMNVMEEISIFGSMGVYGIKERVRSMDGKIEFISSPDHGLSIFISVPIS